MMNEHTDSSELFTSAELEAMVASAMEAQREFGAFAEWLQSPDGKAWVDQQVQEATTIAENFQRECAAGKYVLSPDELEQLRRDGVFVSHHKKGADND